MDRVRLRITVTIPGARAPTLGGRRPEEIYGRKQGGFNVSRLNPQSRSSGAGMILLEMQPPVSPRSRHGRPAGLLNSSG